MALAGMALTGGENGAPADPTLAGDAPAGEVLAGWLL